MPSVNACSHDRFSMDDAAYCAVGEMSAFCGMLNAAPGAVTDGMAAWLTVEVEVTPPILAGYDWMDCGTRGMLMRTKGWLDAELVTTPAACGMCKAVETTGNMVEGIRDFDFWTAALVELAPACEVTTADWTGVSGGGGGNACMKDAWLAAAAAAAAAAAPLKSAHCGFWLCASAASCICCCR